MSARPSIILHPGLPKCATSTIQRLFVLQDHALGRALGTGVIGRDFRVDNGYPDVSKLMYEPDRMAREIAEADLPPGRYFLSNEALHGSPAIAAAIAARLDVTRVLFTVRFPPLQAISNYCYSVWLRSDFASYLTSKQLNPFTATERFRPKFESFRTWCADIRLCPTEGADLEKRFVAMGFDQVPDLLDHPPFATPRRANQSISPAFAAALAAEVQAAGLVVPGPERNALVKRAQAHPLPAELTRLSIPEITALTLADFEPSLAKYQTLLRDYKLPEPDIAEVERTARANIAALIDTPCATPEQMADLRDRARALLFAETP